MIRTLTLAAVFAAAASAALAQATPPPGLSGPELRLPAELDRRLQECFQTDEAELIDRLRSSLTGIDDPANYAPAETLPNGDIIIRRRKDAPPYEPPAGN